MRSILLALVIGIIGFSCTNENRDCSICGDFQLVNFSKEASNVTFGASKSVRRSLNLTGTGGTDYYVLWHWNKETPADSWTQYLTKEIELEKSQMRISEDETWQLDIEIKESYSLMLNERKISYSIKRQFVEIGSWNFLNDQERYLSFERNIQYSNYHVVGKTDEGEVAEDYIQADTLFYNSEKNNRRFELKNESENNRLILKTSGNDRHMAVNAEVGAGYSLMEGNILMTLIPGR